MTKIAKAKEVNMEKVNTFRQQTNDRSVVETKTNMLFNAMRNTMRRENHGSVSISWAMNRKSIKYDIISNRGT